MPECDGISRELYITCSAFNEEGTVRGEQSPTIEHKGRAAFLANAEPVVSILLPVGIAPVAHHLVQFLEACVSIAPQRVFPMIARVVLAAEKGG